MQSRIPNNSQNKRQLFTRRELAGLCDGDSLCSRWGTIGISTYSFDELYTRLRLLGFSDNRNINVARFSALGTCRLYSQRRSLILISLKRLNRRQCRSAVGRTKSLKSLKDSIFRLAAHCLNQLRYHVPLMALIRSYFRHVACTGGNCT
jgi:hypothetical protein